MGAFGAHALKGKLSEYSINVFNKAVLYQMFHSTAIILTVIMNQIYNTNQFNICGWIFVMGIALFSGSLYILSITGVKWLGAITPIGGILFIVSWFIMFYVVRDLFIL